jgi:hypothetical protein
VRNQEHLARTLSGGTDVSVETGDLGMCGKKRERYLRQQKRRREGHRPNAPFVFNSEVIAQEGWAGYDRIFRDDPELTTGRRPSTVTDAIWL